jgi:amino acid transporter
MTVDNSAEKEPDQNGKKPKVRQSLKINSGTTKAVDYLPPNEVSNPNLTRITPALPENSVEDEKIEEAKVKAFEDGYQEHKVKGNRPGDRYIRFTKPSMASNQVWEGHQLHVKVESAHAVTGFGRVMSKVKRVLIGKPIPTAHSAHERLSKFKALAIYSSDALSSIAYATEQILIVLIIAGSGAMSVSIPISVAIALLLVIVGTSYRQTIHAYPKGGGSYIVAKDNLGVSFGLIAASSLMIGYILTVAVSISAGGAAIISAIPGLQPYLVPMCLIFVFLLMIGNLRGVSESGALFSAPTYLFIGTVFLLIFLGLLDAFFGIRFFTPIATEVKPKIAAETLSFFLVLRAFAQGSAFKPPEAKNAAITLGSLITILAIMFLGITYLANFYNVQPKSSHEPGYESVTSQIAHHIVGDSFLYGIFQLATCLILIMGANTAFADFPRLSWFLARDKFLPHLFAHQGDRLAFSTGIISLAVLAGLLIFAFNANVETLVPLYAIGVFTSFTLSQSGMVRRWWRLRTPGWQRSFALNLLGAITTFIVFVILILTQFLNGAWIVVVLVPLMFWGFLVINRYYAKVKDEITLSGGELRHTGVTAHAVVVPINGLNRMSKRTLDYARSLSDDVTAVHVNDNLDEIEQLRRDWKVAGIDIPLVVVETPYRSIIGPLVTYLDKIHHRTPDDIITIVVPEFVATKWWQYFLHNQTALRLKAALLTRRNVVVTSVPYHHEQ